MVIIFASGAGCVEGEGDNARFLILEEFMDDYLPTGDFLGSTGTVTGDVDKSVTSLSGEYFQERGPIDPEEGEYPMVLVFDSDGTCKIYESVNGNWKDYYLGTVRYTAEKGTLSLLLTDEGYENSILIKLGIRDGGAKLSNEDNTFVRM